MKESGKKRREFPVSHRLAGLAAQLGNLARDDSIAPTAQVRLRQAREMVLAAMRLEAGRS